MSIIMSDEQFETMWETLKSRSPWPGRQEEPNNGALTLDALIKRQEPLLDWAPNIPYTPMKGAEDNMAEHPATLFWNEALRRCSTGRLWGKEGLESMEGDLSQAHPWHALRLFLDGFTRRSGYPASRVTFEPEIRQSVALLPGLLQYVWGSTAPESHGVVLKHIMNNLSSQAFKGHDLLIKTVLDHVPQDLWAQERIHDWMHMLMPNDIKRVWDFMSPVWTALHRHYPDDIGLHAPVFVNKLMSIFYLFEEDSWSKMALMYSQGRAQEVMEQLNNHDFFTWSSEEEGGLNPDLDKEKIKLIAWFIEQKVQLFDPETRAPILKASHDFDDALRPALSKVEEGALVSSWLSQDVDHGTLPAIKNKHRF